MSYLLIHKSIMFKFIYSLVAWLATHYDDMPQSFKDKFPKEDVKDFAVICSNISINSKIYAKYE